MGGLGLALGGGGARGLAHIGVIKELLKERVAISHVSGSSIGAFIGACFALTGEIDALEKVAKDFKKQDMLSIIDINNFSVSLMKGGKIRSFLERFLGKKTFTDTKIPLRVCVTSLDDGSTIVISKGNLVDAVIASMSFPGLLPAAKHNGKMVIDGAFSNPVPIDVVLDMGASAVIGVDLFDLDYKEYDEYNMKESLCRAFEIVMERLSYYHGLEYGKNIVLLKPKLKAGLQLIDFYEAQDNIAAGEEVARQMMPSIKRLIR